MTFEDVMRTRLHKRVEANLLRERVCFEQSYQGILSTEKGHFLDFASNDYLGLRADERVAQAWVEGLAMYGSGSGASPLVTGHMKAHEVLEKQIATSLQREAAILFSSGFAANQALCRAMFEAETSTTIGSLICDKYMHASFIDGAQACGAKLKRFKHNDMQHLSNLLATSSKNGPILVASEGVFSMDGDSPDLPQIVSLCEEYGAWLMLDEAHSLGVLGPEKGLGSVEQNGLCQDKLQIVMGTFGKSLGVSGAFIAGSHELISYLVNFARDYIYSTAMPPAQAHAISAAWSIMMSGEPTQQLQDNITYFMAAANKAGIPLMKSVTAIQGVKIGDPALALNMADRLKSLGVWIGAMRYPTVPKGTDRLRITLHASHSRQDIDAAIDAVSLVLNQQGLD